MRDVYREDGAGPKGSRLVIEEEVVPTLLLLRVLGERKRASITQIIVNVFLQGDYQYKYEYNVCVCVYLDGVQLVDAWSEIVGVTSEGDLQQGQELVHPSKQTLRPAARKGERYHFIV